MFREFRKRCYLQVALGEEHRHTAQSVREMPADPFLARADSSYFMDFLEGKMQVMQG